MSTGLASDPLPRWRQILWPRRQNLAQDEQKHRAIVSGHEISHNFGEENYPTDDCPGTTQRNIMRNGTHKDVVGLCYLQSTRNEIKARYFYGQEP